MCVFTFVSQAFHYFSHEFHTHISHVCDQKLHSETCVKRVWSDINPFTHIFTCISNAVSHVNSHWFAIKFHMVNHTNFTCKFSVNSYTISHASSHKFHLNFTCKFSVNGNWYRFTAVSHAYSPKFYCYPLMYNDPSDTGILILNQTTPKIVKKKKNNIGHTRSTQFMPLDSEFCEIENVAHTP